MARSANAVNNGCEFATLLSVATSIPRYQGKPLLRLLELYVLWTIDQLFDSEANTLKEMTPKLAALYEVEGDWHQILSAVMELPPNMPTLIRESWLKNTEIAHKSGVTLTPQQFAEMFVDHNLME